MSFFLLKVSPHLLFSGTEIKQFENPTGLEVRTKNGKSNTCLCKRKDGTWFLQNGNVRVEMKSVDLPEMKIAEEKSSHGKIVGIVNKKYFLQKIN